MSADISLEDSPIIESTDQLVDWFAGGEKRDGPLLIGTEVEKLTFFSESLRPLDYENGIRPILQALTKRGWEASPDGEQPTMLRRGKASVTLEPGGQIELSGAPLETIEETALELDSFLADLRPELAAVGARLSELAMRPDRFPDQVEWMPRERHQLMRTYLQDKGRFAHYMMTLTTTIQANLDYTSEEDMAKKVRVATRLSPLVTALFANSPFGPEGLSGWRSHRAAVWFDVDSARCGFPDVYFSPELSYSSYIDWVLDVPMFFVFRAERYHPVNELTFRSFLKDGWQGERATLADFELHLSTVFPEVRLKRFIECRSADGGPREMTLALPAFWKGLFYDEAALEQADRLTADWTKAQVVQMQRAAAMDGIRAKGGEWKIREAAQAVLEMSEAGLGRLGQGEGAFLRPLKAIVDVSATRADQLIALYQAAEGRWTPERLECVL